MVYQASSGLCSSLPKVHFRLQLWPYEFCFTTKCAFLLLEWITWLLVPINRHRGRGLTKARREITHSRVKHPLPWRRKIEPPCIRHLDYECTFWKSPHIIFIVLRNIPRLIKLRWHSLDIQHAHTRRETHRRIWWVKLEGKRQHGRHRCRREDNIKAGLKEIGLECRGEKDNEFSGSVKLWELLY
jgi:hypothetical protein